MYDKKDKWDDINLMFEDIKNHPYKVEQHDIPEKLWVGYKSTGDGSVWFAHIQTLIDLDRGKFNLTNNPNLINEDILDYFNLTKDERIIKNIIN